MLSKSGFPLVYTYHRWFKTHIVSDKSVVFPKTLCGILLGISSRSVTRRPLSDVNCNKCRDKMPLNMFDPREYR